MLNHYETNILYVSYNWKKNKQTKKNKIYSSGRKGLDLRLFKKKNFFLLKFLAQASRVGCY